MAYKLHPTTRFKKCVRLLHKQGEDLSKLERVIDILATGKALPETCRDHKLVGNRKDYRECHIEPDWLLIYRRRDDALVLTLSETGSHADLLDM
jgi:mRNA interferase YafQ